ncbi:MAG: DJ-1/PfpI family protein [Candidatus Nealsonbacteria bacterium]|nr:DJ-1/PfpI family protein [Candidatus Nealsonbacteria bacterium]
MAGKKIALIIAFRDFRDEEYLEPKKIFEKAGFETTTFSEKTGLALGAYGLEVEVDLLLSDLRVHDFDAVVFVGGSGAARYFQNPHAHRVALQTVLENKVLGAICIAPAILALAGVLKNKKATVWSSNMDKSFIETLKKEGAIYSSEPVVADEQAVTASGPEAAPDFAQAIIDKLK